MKIQDRERASPRSIATRRLSLMFCGVSAIALTSVAAPVFAQDAPAAQNEDVTEVVVTGIRRSLSNAQSLKQNADVISDSITAEDIGALPDRSVTEALQRIPGVSIDRFSAGVDPDHFSAEGSGVTVRGLNLTRSELNGRDVFSANNGRGLSFADVPSELMGGVDVFKNPSADMIEGGIAGTVNLRTRVPFDSKGQVFSFSAEGSYGDFAKKWTPSYSALYSNRWDTELGQFGVLLNYVNSELTTRSDGIQLSNYACRTNVVKQPGATPIRSTAVDCDQSAATANGIYFPRGTAMRSQTTDRKREGIGFAAQWRSNDDTLLATFQFLRSEATQAWTEHAIEIATDNVTSNGDSFPIFNSDVKVDSSGVFTEGTISSNSTGWRADIGSAGDKRTPIYGLQSNNIRRDQQQNYMTQDMGFNLRWTPNDHWGIKFDVQHVKSDTQVIDNGVWGSTYQDVRIKTNGTDMPEFTFLAPTRVSSSGAACSAANGNFDGNGCGTYLQGANNSFENRANNFWRSAMDHFEDSEGELTSVRADAEYLFDDNNYVKAIDFGVRWADRDMTTRFSSYNWGRLSESWGNNGQVWMDEAINGYSAAGAAPVEVYRFDNFLNGEVANPLGAQGRLFSTLHSVDEYAQYVKMLTAIGETWAPLKDANGAVIAANATTCANGTVISANWVPASGRCDVIPGTNYRRNEVNPVQETNKAAYVMVKYNHLFDNGMKLSGNVGLRYTHTDRTSTGYLAFPSVSITSDQSCIDAQNQAQQQGTPYVPSFVCAQTPAERQRMRNFLNGAITPINDGTTYRYLLPSFNARLQVNPQLVLRLGLSETLTPPEVGLTRAYYNMTLTLNPSGFNPANGVPSPDGATTVGNPKLKPTKSDNIDMSAEWYFAPVGSVTLALFHKELTDVVSNTTERVPFTNNGSTYEVIVTTPGNSPDKGKIKGFELAYQQTYDFLPAPFNGLGINANYSYIKSSGVKQSTLSSTDPDVAAGRTTLIDTSLLPLQGLSKHNGNFTVFYEKYGVSARLAYNYRSDFLVTVRDVIVPNQPIMQEGGGQLDGSFFYSVTPKIKVGFQAVNINNQITHTRAVLNNQLLTAGRSWFVNDRRITFIIRGTF